MKPRLVLMASILALGAVLSSAMAQDPAVLKDARQRFNLVATRAVANFRSADSIEARLKAEGATLNPQLIAMRLRIEGALDEAQAALDKSDVDGAKKATARAEGLVEQFARRLGGD